MKEQSPRSFIKTLSIIHMGLVTGPLLFGCIAYFMAPTTFFDFSFTSDVFMLLVLFFALSGITMGDYIFKQSIRKIPNDMSLLQKLMHFRTASIIKYALHEAPAFIGIIAFFQTKNLAFLLISGVLLVYLSLLRPEKEKISKALNLKGGEKEQFNKLDTPIQ